LVCLRHAFPPIYPILQGPVPAEDGSEVRYVELKQGSLIK
jgi:hypothetical protein